MRPPWEGLSSHFTKGFEAFAVLLMREMPVSKVGEITGETDTRLWRMLFRQVDAAYAQADFSNVCCVGVDDGVRNVEALQPSAMKGTKTNRTIRIGIRSCPFQR